MMKNRSQTAVTIIELLVVIGIIAVLAGILTPVVSHMRKQGRMVQETSAARQVIAAYLTAANDDNGQLPAGYNMNLLARDDRGNELHGPSSARYPWRIAPYLSYNLKVLYGNVGDDRLATDREQDHDAWVYAASVAPALGMNTQLVGGDYSSLNPENPRLATYGDFCVNRLGEAVKPSWLIVFASACFEDGKTRVPGYFKVEPPSLTGRSWKREYKPNASAGSYGQVDFRYGDRAIAAMLDGHVELFDFEQMDDMRRWSNQAADANTEEWRLGATQ